MASLASLATIATVAGTVVSTAASYQQNKFQQDIAKTNASKARQDAAAQEAITRRDSRRQIATARARYGAAGVELSGSPLSVLGDLSAQAEEQALLIRYGGASAAHNSQLQAQSFGSQARGSLISGGARSVGVLGQQMSTNYDNFGSAFPGFGS